MIALRKCTAYAGLSSNEMFIGVTPSARHGQLLSSYLLNLKRGPPEVRDMIVADLRCFLDIGAQYRAADLLIVLRRFLSDYPEARCVPRQYERTNITRIPLSSMSSFDARRKAAALGLRRARWRKIDDEAHNAQKQTIIAKLTTLR